MTYYNDNDAKCCAWLRELIKEKLIPDGEIDCRSISDVQPSDLRGFSQCHFFAGIGGWPFALRIAGWPDDREVWTGSCPCQPFSTAGKAKGQGDDRHLWPQFYRLISKLKPERVFGEQVAQAIGFNWLDGISADLESQGYQVGAIVLGAHSVGAPQIRKRLYWVADADRGQCEQCSRTQGNRLQRPANNGEPGRMADTKGGDGEIPKRAEREAVLESGRRSGPCGLVNANHQGPQGRNGIQLPERAVQFASGAGVSQGFWSDAIWHPCLDGKWRRIPTEPALFPLANGIPGRVGLLRGAGNAIVPELAAEFIKAFCETKITDALDTTRPSSL